MMFGVVFVWMCLAARMWNPLECFIARREHEGRIVKYERGAAP